MDIEIVDKRQINLATTRHMYFDLASTMHRAEQKGGWAGLWAKSLVADQTLSMAFLGFSSQIWIKKATR